MASDKDTIYIDVDDEITGIIDKLQASSGKVVALVLPKRAAVFQSIVNMKLLKRAADSANKKLVLITTEAGLLPLAGAAGVHVARTLNSKPEIPNAPKLTEDKEEAVDESAAEEITAATAGSAAVGDLAGKPPADSGMETLTLDDSTLPPESVDNPPKPKDFKPPAKAKKNKKFKIPNFNRFRLLMLGGILLLVLLIVFLFLAIKVLPKATITLNTDAQKLDSNLTLNLSTSAEELDPDTLTVPAELAQTKKTYSQTVATTGQTNNGNKASGTVVLTNCSKQTGSVTIPAGTGVSSEGNTYITQKAVTLPESTFNAGGSCTGDSQGTVNITAQSPGTAYNGATSFTVAGYSGVTGSPQGSISGGTDKIVKSVNQNDINNAKDKIDINDPGVKDDLEDELRKDGWFVIDASFKAGDPAETTSANVGDVADNVTVTQTVTYMVFGVHKKDLETLVKDDVSTQIDTSKQKIQDTGIDSADFQVTNASASGAQVVMDTQAVTGPDIDVGSIKKNARGKKAGQIKKDLNSNPDIKSVDVDLSPFWVSAVPKDTSKIKVVIAEPKTVSNSNDSGQ